MKKKERYIINHETMALLPIKDQLSSQIHTLVYEVNQIFEVGEMPDEILKSSRHYHQDCKELNQQLLNQELNITAKHFFPVCLLDLQVFIKIEKEENINAYKYLSVRHIRKIKKIKNKTMIIFSNSQSKRVSLSVNRLKKRRDLAFAIIGLGYHNLEGREAND